MSDLPDSSLVIWVISGESNSEAIEMVAALRRDTQASIKHKVIGASPWFARLSPSLQLLLRPKPIKYGLMVGKEISGPDFVMAYGDIARAPIRALQKVKPSLIELTPETIAQVIPPAA